MKVTLKQLREAGIEVPPARTKRGGGINLRGSPASGKKTASTKDGLFAQLCQAHGLPDPVGEYPFAKHLGRDWRFDWLFEGWLALEVEGGVWSQGRHVRGKGFLADMEKYNEAAILGFTVLRCATADVQSGAAFALVRRALDAFEDMA